MNMNIYTNRTWPDTDTYMTRTWAWTWHGNGHGHGRVDVDMNMDMDYIRSVFMSLPMSVSEKWESWQRSVKKYSGKWQFCGELPSPPGDSQTSPAYSIHFVQYLYINQLLPANKPVLSYLLLCLLPQCWPQSGWILCIVHCTFEHSHVGSHQRQLLSLPSL